MPVTPIESCRGKACASCHGPATHACGLVWLCCDCHCAPGEGVRPKTVEQWAELVDRLGTALDVAVDELKSIYNGTAVDPATLPPGMAFDLIRIVNGGADRALSAVHQCLRLPKEPTDGAGTAPVDNPGCDR